MSSISDARMCVTRSRGTRAQVVARARCASPFGTPVVQWDHRGARSPDGVVEVVERDGCMRAGQRQSTSTWPLSASRCSSGTGLPMSPMCSTRRPSSVKRYSAWHRDRGRSRRSGSPWPGRSEFSAPSRRSPRGESRGRSRRPDCRCTWLGSEWKSSVAELMITMSAARRSEQSPTFGCVRIGDDREPSPSGGSSHGRRT